MVSQVKRAAIAALLLSFATFSKGEVLNVEIQSARSQTDIQSLVSNAAKNYNLRLARYSENDRLKRGGDTPFSMPVRVNLLQSGRSLPPTVERTRAPGDSITLQFETSGSRSFPSDYRLYLQSVFAAAKPAMEAIFGPPSFSGTVKVLNYDADIPARQAVSGGVYVHNGTSGPEIQFPVYQSATAAGVNFVHTLLLAYLGNTTYPFDAYEEGFVRAATMVVARSSGSIPNSTPELIEGTLDSLYDASSFYDWSNTPGLGAPNFIAPNLLTAPLPTGGSTGGIFLLRHQMAGTAWGKVVSEFPGFIKEFNRRYQLSPSSYQTEAQLINLGQAAINTVAGTPNTQVEGVRYSDWVLRQSVLDPNINAGVKVVPQAFPVAPTGGSSDFGVFGIVVNAFRTDPNGNETLLNGTCYPCYWRPDFTRFFTSAQDDVAPISGAYGSVVPNFPGDTFSNQPYRVAVDLPFLGKTARMYLPAGAIATGSQPVFKNAYGTLTGFPIENGVNYAINLTWTGGSQSNISVRNFAFGVPISATSFDNAQPVTIDVFRVTQSSAVQVMSRRVNKGKGPLVVDLRSDDCYSSFVLGRPNRLGLIGFPLQPYRPNPADVLKMNPNQTLVARYNPFGGTYDLFPKEGEFREGLGYFARTNGDPNLIVEGLTSAETPIAVGLQAGWNLVTVPFNETVTTNQVAVTTSTDSLSTYSQAQGDLIGQTFFRFNPDPVNPDLGTLIAANTFVPGQAYFVRALKPEGAVLLFTPSAGSQNSLQNSPTRSPSVGTSLGRQFSQTRGRGFGTVATQGAFSGKLIFQSRNGHYAQLSLIQRANATPRGDLSEDSELAPGPGGFQAFVINHRRLYEDIRPIGPTTYIVRMVGLIPGEYYSMNWLQFSGSTRFVINNNARLNLTSNQPYGFYATDSVMNFYLRSN